MNNEDFKKIRSIVQEELEPVKRVQQEHTDKIDSLIVDMSEAQDRLDTIWEKVSVESDKTKKDIEDIKTHIGSYH